MKFLLILLIILILILQYCNAFTRIASNTHNTIRITSSKPLISRSMSVENKSINEDNKFYVTSLALLTTASILLPEQANAVSESMKPFVAARPILDLFVNTMSFLFLGRIVMSWYPNTNIKEFPFNALVWPTEPLLAPARAIIPPAFGVDVSAIAWVMLLSFVREVLTGSQGVLSVMERY